MNKKSVLVILTRFPYPPIDGTRITILYNVLSGLKKKFSVSLCIITLEKPTNEQIKYFKDNFKDLKVFFIPKIKFYLKSLMSFITRYPMQTYGHYIREADDWLRTELKNYDAVFVQTIRLGKYFESASNDIKLKSSIHFQDAFSLNYQTAKKLAPPIWRMIYLLEEKKVRNYETEMFKYFSHLTIVSVRDKHHIEANSKNLKNDYFRFIQIPFGVRDTLIEIPKGEKRDGLVFIGNLLYPPNFDGVKYFCDNIWGELRKRFPELRCTIIGKGKELFKKEYNGIEFTGFVEDAFPLLSNSRIFISPIRFGAGMITKVVEAMALSLPVITSPVCADGIDGAKHNENILIAEMDDKKEWIEQISKLLMDDNYCSKISQNGFKLVKSYYLNSIVEERWIKHFEEVINFSETGKY